MRESQGSFEVVHPSRFPPCVSQGALERSSSEILTFTRGSLVLALCRRIGQGTQIVLISVIDDDKGDHREQR